MENPILSILIPTYNHENYIAQALDSVLMQKTQYPFEVLVGEDCSTDGTREILKAYEENYPGFFSMFYRDHNLFNEKFPNGIDLMFHSKGKYLITLEGDDYWTDPNKIEKQISFLESHPEYYAVAHNCLVVGNDSEPNGEKYPECKDEEYTYRHYFSEIMPGQTATFMYRNYLPDDSFHKDYPEIPKGTPSDRVLYYMMLVNDKRIYCMQETMSAYRHVVDSGSSFSATYKYNFNVEEKWLKAMMDYTERYKPSWNKYVKCKYLTNLIRAFQRQNLSVKSFREYFIREKLYNVLPICIKRYMNHHVLKKTFWI